jgi:hypothetical protein
MVDRIGQPDNLDTECYLSPPTGAHWCIKLHRTFLIFGHDPTPGQASSTGSSSPAPTFDKVTIVIESPMLPSPAPPDAHCSTNPRFAVGYAGLWMDELASFELSSLVQSLFDYC